MTMTTVDRVVALHRVPLFADVPGRVLAALAMRATEVEVAAGDVLIEQGAVEDHLYAVVSGRFVARDGERTLRELGPGSTVGELAALAPEPRSASVTALEDGLLLRIDKVLLDELLADRPELARAVIASLVRMLRNSPAGE
ncbi:MAG: cyclic nucleotide-binding protein [Ornithinibacter sp.]|nr:cyclic nucleotide-binding protein [Ornithinibacter sp.]